MYCKKAIRVTFLSLASILAASSLFGQATGTLAGTVEPFRRGSARFNRNCHVAGDRRYP